MPLSGKARVLLAVALLQRQGSDAFMLPAKCFHTHPTTHAEHGLRSILRQLAPYITPPNITPVNITALNITQPDCVELVGRVRPSRAPICNMVSESQPAMHLDTLAAAYVAVESSVIVYQSARCLNNLEVKRYFFTWEGGWGYRAEAATPGTGTGSEPPTELTVCAVLQEAVMHYTDWIVLLEYATALLLPLNSFRYLVPSEQWQTLSVAFPADFPGVVCMVAISRAVCFTCWETARARKIKLALKLRTTGNLKDAEDANNLIMAWGDVQIDETMAENCDMNSCAIFTIGDVFLAVVACATPVEWAHFPFYPSYDLGLPMSPFAISALLGNRFYAYQVKGEADEGAASGSLVARDASSKARTPKQKGKQEENKKTEDTYGKQPGENREGDPDGDGEL